LESLATEEEEYIHDIIKEEAHEILRTIVSDEDVSIQSENEDDTEEEEEDPDEGGATYDADEVAEGDDGHSTLDPNMDGATYDANEGAEEDDEESAVDPDNGGATNDADKVTEGDNEDTKGHDAPKDERMIAEDEADVGMKDENLIAEEHHNDSPDGYETAMGKKDDPKYFNEKPEALTGKQQMQHAEGESDDEEFTTLQTSTEKKSSGNNKVAAVENKPDNGA
jgi:hypothetical protein